MKFECRGSPNVFIQLKQLTKPRINPTTIMTDYETAAINAFKTALDVVDRGNLQDLKPHYGTSTMGSKTDCQKPTTQFKVGIMNLDHFCS